MSAEPAAASCTSYSRILLTGGSGFVGGYLAAALASAYPNARRILLTRPGEAASAKGWTSAVAEITDEAAVAAIVGGIRPDLVAHLAAQASAAHSFIAAEETWRINFGGSFNLAAALARHAGEAALLFVSSAEVYGARLREGAVNEDTPPCPLNSYARSKIAAEGMFADVLPPSARLIVARPLSHIGPGQDKRFALSSFAAQIAAIEQGRAPPRLEVGDLSVRRDFLDVRDVVDAYVRLVAAAPGLPPRSVFNISSGTTHSLATLVESLRGQARRDFEIVVDHARLRPSDIPVTLCDSSKLRATTGWRPRHSIDETLVDLLDHWRRAESRVR